MSRAHLSFRELTGLILTLVLLLQQEQNIFVTAQDDFSITKYDPATGNVTVNEGGSFGLKCTANAYLRGCVWRHRDKACKLQYSRTAGGLVKSRCLVYDSKIFVVGDYQKHECAITVTNVELYEHGVWTCEVREYITRLAVWARPRIVKQRFSVEVVPDSRREKFLETRGGFNVPEDDDEDNAVVIEADELDEDERAEAEMALIVISTLFALVVCSMILGVLFLLARKKGWLSKPMSRAKSVRLTDVNNQDSYSEEEGSPNHVATNPIGTVGGGLDGSTELPENLPNEKAMSQLGLQMTYSASRRVM